MNKENISIQNPEEKTASLVRRIERREGWLQNIGVHGKVKAGSPLEKTIKLDEAKINALIAPFNIKDEPRIKVIVPAGEVTRKVGKVRQDVAESVRKLKTKLKELDPNMARARDYLDEENERRKELIESSQLLATGNLSEYYYQRNLNYFNEFTSQAEESPLKDGIQRVERIRQEEISRKETKKASPKPVEVFISQDPADKKEVFTILAEVLDGLTPSERKLLDLLIGTTRAKLAVSEELNKEFFKKSNRESTDSLRGLVGFLRKRLRGSGLEIIVVRNTKERPGGYYLHKGEQINQPKTINVQITKPEEEDNEVFVSPTKEIIIGELARLYNILKGTSIEGIQYSTSEMLDKLYFDVSKKNAKAKLRNTIQRARMISDKTGIDIVTIAPRNKRNKEEGKYYSKTK